MPMAGYDNFDDCVSKVMDKEGLSEEEAKKYCGKIKAKTEGTEKSWTFDLDVVEKIADTEDGELVIAGYASNGNRDQDSEYMDMESLKATFSEYMENPVVRFMHDKAPQWKGAVGRVIPEYTDSDGVVHKTKFDTQPYLVIKISNNSKLGWLRQMVKDGDITGLSIGGKALIEKATGRIKMRSWLETSLVDVPSAKGSFVKVLKEACIDENCQTEPEPEPMVKNCDAIKMLSCIINNPEFDTSDVAKIMSWDEAYVTKVVDFVNNQSDYWVSIDTPVQKRIKELYYKI